MAETSFDAVAGSLNSNHTYSTTEKAIGTWINGSTIYRISGKTDCDGANIAHVLHTFSTNITVIDMYATTTNNADNYARRASYGILDGIGNPIGIWYNNDDKKMYFQQGLLNTIFNVYWSIEYIK